MRRIEIALKTFNDSTYPISIYKRLNIKQCLKFTAELGRYVNIGQKVIDQDLAWIHKRFVIFMMKIMLNSTYLTAQSKNLWRREKRTAL